MGLYAQAILEDFLCKGSRQLEWRALMPQRVEIRVKGCIDEHWTEWFEGFEIAYPNQDETTLIGSIRDQTALYGMLTKLRDLGLDLVSVNPSEP